MKTLNGKMIDGNEGLTGNNTNKGKMMENAVVSSGLNTEVLKDLNKIEANKGFMQLVEVKGVKTLVVKKECYEDFKANNDIAMVETKEGFIDAYSFATLIGRETEAEDLNNLIHNRNKNSISIMKFLDKIDYATKKSFENDVKLYKSLIEGALDGGKSMANTF